MDFIGIFVLVNRTELIEWITTFFLPTGWFNGIYISFILPETALPVFFLSRINEHGFNGSFFTAFNGGENGRIPL